MRKVRNKLKLHGPLVDAPWTSIQFASCLKKACTVECQILDECKRHHFSESDIFALKLALEEALTNAVRHGNKLDPAKHVTVEYRVTPQRADVVIQDEGKGFNPASLPDPTADENLENCNGRGILLMRAYMNSVVFSPSGNKVTLTKFNETQMPPAESSVAFG